MGWGIGYFVNSANLFERVIYVHLCFLGVASTIVVLMMNVGENMEQVDIISPEP